MRKRSNETNCREKRQAKIPQRHCAAPVPSWATSKVVLSGNTAKQINRNGDNWHHRTPYHLVTEINGVIVVFKAKNRPVLEFVRHFDTNLQTILFVHSRKICLSQSVLIQTRDIFESESSFIFLNAGACRVRRIPSHDF